jgi:hypothetical protein
VAAALPRSSEFDAAAHSVEDWIGAFENVRLLRVDECASYEEGRSIQRGWALDLTADPEVQSEVRVLLPEFFPYARPLIAVSAKQFLAWPHIEEDGVVCALPLSASIDPYRPLAVTQYVLNEALAVIKQGRSGANIDDFRDEFHSYWDRARTENSVPVVSTLSDFSAPRTVSSWFGKNMIVVGDTDDAVSAWMDNQFGTGRERRSYEPGTLLNLEAALLPGEYPRHISDLERIIQSLDVGARTVLSKQLSLQSSRNLVIFDAPTRNGRALAAIRLNPPAAKNMNGHKIDVLQKGFRPGRIPEGLKLNRYLQHAPAPTRLKVKRADSLWIHGRESDIRSEKLASTCVAIIGVGSIGSFVAELLAASGVGKITLVDTETLTFANASRHLLGANSEGQYKALAVAELLQKRFPHHAIIGLTNDGRSFLQESIESGEAYDLIISVAGDWELDCLLNDLVLKPADARQPMRALFGWSEPHAVAGHGLLLTGGSGCLLCHFSDDGLPEMRVAEWDHETMLSEPACGGQFQPYGAVEIMSINTMIASLAIDSLLERISENAHRIYASEEARLQGTGGRVTSEWKSTRTSVPADVSVVLTRPWSKRDTCRHCGVTNAP